MDLLAMLILIGAVGAIILCPLVRRPAAVPADGPPPPEAARTRLALTAIKELEFDYETGKIGEADYQALRARYDARAVDALEHSESRRSVPAPAPVDATAQIEAEVRAARTRRFCMTCGGPMPKTARFCPTCGTSVEVKG